MYASPILCRHASMWLYKVGPFLLFFYGLAIDYAIEVGHKRIMEKMRPD